MKKILFLLIVMLFYYGCSNKKEIALSNLLKIELAGDLAERNLEASGMAWYKENLIILPQFPHKWDDKFDGAIYLIPKVRIEKFINGEDVNPILGEKIQFVAMGLDEIGKRKGSGYEAITFIDDTVFASIESLSDDELASYVVKGVIDLEKKRIVLDSNSKFKIKSQTNIHNMGEETILEFKKNIYTIHEANGVNVNEVPYATKIDFNLFGAEKFPFPNIEYRITDATHVDSNGIFYAINYFYPGEFKKLKPNLNEMERKKAVEQILEFQIMNNKIERTSRKAIDISNPKSKNGRNWEGIVKLNNGFLLITDMFPETILGYYKEK